MRPYCERHARYHYSRDECLRMDAAARRLAAEQDRRRRAERIARAVLAANLANPDDADKSDEALRQIDYSGARVREMLTAAALQALTESEQR